MGGTTLQSDSDAVPVPKANPQPGCPQDSLIRGWVSEALESGRYFLHLGWIDDTAPVERRLRYVTPWREFPPGDLPKMLALLRDKIATHKRSAAEAPVSAPAPIELPEDPE